MDFYLCAEDGKVLTWGHGGHGQLGHGDLANVKVPKVVEALGDHKVSFIACGGAWTSAVTGTIFLPYIRL
jgi:alpha-tubulin suppressor-like RCC1 family protein